MAAQVIGRGRRSPMSVALVALALALADDSREEASRLEGVLLAARTLEHYANNRLALTAGYAELLAHHPRLAPELREWAEAALQGALAAAVLVQELGRVTRLEEVPGPGGTLLDLERSAVTRDPRTAAGA